MDRTRWTVALVAGVVLSMGVGTFLWEQRGGDDVRAEVQADTGTADTSTADTRGGDTGEDPTTTAPTTTAVPRPPADTLRMQKFTTISGDISPKSVVASNQGLVTAQNMMYTHTVTAYDGDGALVATVPDTVRLSDFGIDKPGEYQGAPVEAAFTSDGSQVYVSNYSMYGPGFREGKDSCTPESGVPPSYLYRISTEDWKINQVVPVGAVPKYVAVTPDDELVLTSNWCTWDLSVADTRTGQEIRRIPMGRYPRGIAISPDGATAYVALMGDSKVARVDLDDFSVSWITNVGLGPRHVVLSPDGAFLYTTNNKEGSVSKVDTASGAVVKKVRVGSQPRSMAISTDGTALYNVNYDSDTISKLDADDLTELQEIPVGHHPIGIAYDGSTGRVWVANYSGTIMVFDES